MKLFVRDLTVIDASYLSVARGMVGESWLVDVELSGELNAMSMLLDFARVKKEIKSIIDKEVDHRLLIPTGSAYTHVSAVADSLCVDFMRPARSIHLRAPAQAFCLLPADEVTASTVSAYLQALIGEQLPGNIDGLTIHLRPEAIATAFYHYSHGLKKHDGNCQRIAHGHRSMLELWVDGERDSALEQQWATRWADIYLGSLEDRVPVAQLELSERAAWCQEPAFIGFRYQAPQGDFQLLMARDGGG